MFNNIRVTVSKATNYTTDAVKDYYAKQPNKAGFIIGCTIAGVCWVFALTYFLSFALTSAITTGLAIIAFNIITTALVEYRDTLKGYDLAASMAHPVN